MWPSVPQMWLSHGCCQGCCASRQECRPRCGQGWRWGLGRETELLLGFRRDTVLRKKKYLVFGFPKIFSLFLGGKRFVQINTPPSCTQASSLRSNTSASPDVRSDLCALVLLLLGTSCHSGRAAAAASVSGTGGELSLLAQQVGIFPRLRKHPAFPGPQR